MTTEPLALKYRPTTFADMVGQRLHAAVLQQMVDTGNVPPAVLFSGPSGVGKTSAARILASALGAEDVIEVDAASNGGVAEVRKLLETIRFATGGAYRVVILDEAQSISKQGFEAFLKTLEEPPDRTVFVLTTTEAYKIPETIQSRLIEFQFRALAAGDVASRLAYVAVHEQIRVERGLVLHLANRADGNMRGALQLLDLVSRAKVETLDAYLEMAGEGDPAPALMAALVTNDHERIFAVLDEQLAIVGSARQITAELIALIRDLFILRAGGELPEGQRLEIRKHLASRIDSDKLLLAIRVLWDLNTKIRGHDDPKGMLTMALVLIAEVLSSGNPQRVAPAPVASSGTPKTPPKRMTLAEMQRG